MPSNCARPDGSTKMTTVKGFEYVHKTKDSEDRYNYDILISDIIDNFGCAAWYRGLVGRAGIRKSWEPDLTRINWAHRRAHSACNASPFEACWLEQIGHGQIGRPDRTSNA